MEINERWIQDVNVNYTNSQYNGSAQTPEGSYSYRLRSPYRFNAGAAFTFAGMALVSADYEMTDYSTMKFMSKDGGWDSTYDTLNDEIRDCMGVSHMIRIGAEFKPTPEFAVRAGYNFTTTPEYVSEGCITTKLNDRINAFSVGLGYSSNGSFFADIAARLMLLADEYVSPYANYLSDLDSPLILNKRDIYSVTATFGWRF
jgi:opacity protein-like surface antigen